MKKKPIDDVEIIDDDETIIKRKIKKSKKKIKLLPFIILGVIIFGIGSFIVITKKQEKKRLEQEEKLIEEINNHYHEYVKVDNKTSLFRKNDDEYKEVAIVYPGVILNLEEEKIDAKTQYFKVKDQEYYISYQDIQKSEQEKNNERYKNYLPFNENIVTKDTFTLYSDDKELYTFHEAMEFPIIIKDYENKYYIEYNNQLLSIKKEDVKDIKEANNTTKKNQSKITTLAYHQVEEEGKNCADVYVCIQKDGFDQEMKYLKDNNYFTLTMEELYMYLKGNLQIEKGIVLTFDDGFKTKSTIEILEKYDLMGTIFVITKHFENMDEFKSDNVLVQSHTNNMHRNYVCSGGNQGGAILCASEKEIMDDLKTSIEKTGTPPYALAFPFYDYNEKALKVVKEAGFKMSFIGRGGVMGKATPNVTDVYKIPRMTAWDLSVMSFNEWKSYL